MMSRSGQETFRVRNGGKWIVTMAPKVNLKEYIAIAGRWRFVPVLKIAGKPRPEAAIVGGETVKGIAEKFYIEWREDGKRIQRPTDRHRVRLWMNGVIRRRFSTGPSRTRKRLSPCRCRTYRSRPRLRLFPSEVKATKSAATLDADKADLVWFKKNLQRGMVGKVTRADIMHLFGAGRDEDLHQGSINRRVMSV
jgi:hypothetical protein